MENQLQRLRVAIQRNIAPVHFEKWREEDFCLLLNKGFGSLKDLKNVTLSPLMVEPQLRGELCVPLCEAFNEDGLGEYHRLCRRLSYDYYAETSATSASFAQIFSPTPCS